MPARSRPDRLSGAALRAIVTVIGSLALIASAFTPWGRGYKASNIGADVLYTKDATAEAGFFTSIGLVTVILGVIALVGLIPRRGWLTSAAGIGGIVIFVLFLVTHLVRADFAATALNYGSMTFLLLGGLFLFPAAFVGDRHQPLVTLSIGGTPRAGEPYVRSATTPPAHPGPSPPRRQP